MKARARFRLFLVAVMVCAMFGLQPFAPIAHADGFIDFENGVDGEPIRSTIPGLQFTTTEGYDWIYGDWRTGKYNGPYPNNGKYYSNGNFFAWLGPNQGMGQIDFTLGGATYIQVWVSSLSGLSVEAYNKDRKRLGSAHVAGNLSTGAMARLRVTAPAGEKIAYVQFHDSGNQWLIDDLSTDAAGVPEQRPPVVLIPGLMGSQLDEYDSTTRARKPVWPPLYDPNTHTVQWLDLPKLNIASLELNADGRTPRDSRYSISTTAVLDYVYEKLGPVTIKEHHPYDRLIQKLTDEGYRVYQYHYDWRRDVREAPHNPTPESAAQDLAAYVDHVLAETGARKVNIVAHSLGGLVTRAYVSSSPQNGAKVEQAVILGTPYMGAPEAWLALRSGNPELLSFWAYAIPPIKWLILNYPSVYQITPSQRYWDLNGGSWYLKDFKPQSYTDYESFFRKNYNSGLVDSWKQLHDSIDTWNNLPTDVEFRFIVGSGNLNTIGMVIETHSPLWPGGVRWDTLPINGDGTVPVMSASLQGNGLNYRGRYPVWYVNRVDHGALTQTDYVLDFVVALLSTAPDSSSSAEYAETAASVLPRDQLLYQGEPMVAEPRQKVTAPPLPPGMSETPFPVDGAQIAVFHAAELHLYDSTGRHTGPRSNGSIETGIPHSSYEKVGPGLFATVPAGGIYRTEIVPIRGEQFDVRVRDVEGVETNFIQRTIVYDSMTLPGTSSGSISINPDNLDSATQMSIDLNGDGKPDSAINATSDLPGSQSYDFEGPQANISASGARNSRGYTGKVRITITASDNQSGLLGIKYSLDGGRTFVAYQGPFDVIAETNPSIWADASDKAGNHTVRHLRLIPLLIMMPSVSASTGAAAPESWHPTAGLAGRTVLDLSSAGSSCNTVYAATDAGVYRSADGGQSWEQRLAAPANAGRESAPVYEGAADVPATVGMATAVTVCPVNPAVVYAGSWGNGVYRSADGGATWQQRAGGLIDPWIYDIAVAENSCDVVYVATSSGGVFKTASGGGSWQAVNNGLNNRLTRSLTMVPGNPSRIYVGSTSGVWRSDNAAGSWIATNNQLPAATVWSLAAPPGNGDLIYAGLDGQGVYRSATAGSAWIAASVGMGNAQVRALVVDPLAPSTLYAGREDGGGVYRSADGAGAWSAFNNGLGSPTVKSLWLDGGACHRLLAGSGNGVWRYGK